MFGAIFIAITWGILGLPFAYILHKRYKRKWNEAIFQGAMMAGSVIILGGLILSITGVIDLGTTPSVSFVSPKPTNKHMETIRPISTITEQPPVKAFTTPTPNSWRKMQSTEYASRFGMPMPTDWGEQYNLRNCNQNLPLPYTNINCYVIDGESHTRGYIYFSGKTITRIKIEYYTDSSKDAINTCGKFVIEVAEIAGWDITDLNRALLSGIDTQEQGWTYFNTIAVQRSVDNYKVWLTFDQAP